MDLITIGIPIYNVEKYVERALLSALNQTYPNIEYIIVDDKGSDNSMKIVEQIKNSHIRGAAMKTIDHVVNRYLGATRNTAIENAKGKYIYFFDSDDEITPDCIEILHSEIVKTDADFVGGSRKILKGDETVFTENYPDFFTKDKEKTVLSYFNNTSLYITNKLFKVSFLNENNLRVGLGTIEDINFSFRVALKATKVCHISKITYLYYMNDMSVSSAGVLKKKLFESLLHVFEEEQELIKQAEWSKMLRIKVKKKFFAQRLLAANDALKSKDNVQHYIQDYLNPHFFDKDIWKSMTLFVFYLYSQMPLGIKKVTIPILMTIKNLLK
jgi:glycosyltransferase involved in cell wall biosynthesis